MKSAFGVLLLSYLLGAILAKVSRIPVKHIESPRKKLIREGKWLQHEQSKMTEMISTNNETLRDYNDVEYVTGIELGTPPQRFDVILDTSTALLWVPDNSCLSLACLGKNKFNKSASTTYTGNDTSTAKKWKLDGGLLRAQGYLGRDTFCLSDNLCVPDNQVFGQATKLSPLFGHTHFDGILGMAWPALAPDQTVPPINNLLPELDQPLFTVWFDRLGRTSGKNNGGLVTYGALDEEHCHIDQMSYQPLTAKTFWQFLMTEVSVGSFTAKGQMQAISHTASSLILGPPHVIASIGEKIGAVNIQGFWFVDCNVKADPIVLTIGDNKYSIEPRHYIEPIDKEGRQCYAAISGIYGAGFGFDWVLGAPFIRSYCNVYDIGAARIGFAPVKHNL